MQEKGDKRKETREEGHRQETKRQETGDKETREKRLEGGQETRRRFTVDVRQDT